MLSTKTEITVSEAAALLQPGSVLLLGTLLPDGRPNVMALAWYTITSDNPVRIACVLRNDRLSRQALVEHGECILNIPSLEQIEQVLACGTLSARDMDKLACLGWTTSPASRVGVPLVVESSAHIECRVIEQREMGDCSIFELEAVAASIDHAAELPQFQAAPGSLLLRARREIDRRRDELRNVIELTARQHPADALARSLFN